MAYRAYKPVREILESVRQFHRQLRRQMEDVYSETEDPRSKYLLRSLRRSEQEMDLALGQYEQDGDSTVLDTWIQYVSSEEVDDVLNNGRIPPHSSPDEVLEWKQQFDKSLAGYYRQLAEQISAPRARELLESLAVLIEQRLAEEAWQVIDEDLAPDE